MATSCRLPNFVGIGGHKCASTWLSECLRYHPDVFLSSPKELHFFSSDKWQDKIDRYSDVFRHATGQTAAGEFSTGYLSHPEAARRIRSLLGQVRIIVTLRDPVERFVSHYKHYIRDNKITGPPRTHLSAEAFDLLTRQFPELLDRGRYFTSLSRYWDQFDERDILVVLKDEIDAAPKSAVRRLYQFLNVDAGFLPPILTKQVSPGILPKSRCLETLRIRAFRHLKRSCPQAIDWIRRLRLSEGYRWLNGNARRDGLSVDPKVYRLLADYYRLEVQELSARLRCDLRHWLEPTSKPSGP